MSLLLTILAAQADPLVAIVVVDQEARDQGYALQLDGWLVEDALPIDVVQGEKVHLVDADGRRELLDVAAGEAWEITGAEGEAWMSTLGDEVRTDLVAIRGDAEAIVDIATRLGVELLRDGDEYYLKGGSVLFDVPWLESRVATRIDEVRLVRVGETVKARPLAAPSRPVADPSTRPSPPIRSAGANPRKPGIVPTVNTPMVAPAVYTPPAPAAVPSVAPLLRQPHRAERAVERIDARLAMRDDYVGLFDCRDEPLLLNASGTFSFAGRTGMWLVSAPGVIHLLGDEDETWAKVAIDPVARHCRDAW